MSKIALEGNASGTGTFTIASPNSNSNYTLTLPSSTGTVVVTGGAQTIEFAAGSAASPSITFTGDTNTGIFSPGADTIAFSEGGVESMRIDSSGNVGIGTSSPSQKLHLAGGSFRYMRVDVGTTAAGLVGGESNLFILGYNTVPSLNNVLDSSLGTGRLDFGNSSGGYIAFLTGATNTTPTERMRINSSGNVGIGTSSPNAKLELSGTGPVNFRLSDTITNWWQLESNSYLAFNRGGIEHARITSGGYFKASNDGTYMGSTASYHEFKQSANDKNIIVTSTNASYASQIVLLEGSRNTTNGTWAFLRCYNNADKLYIYDSGNVVNVNGSYGTLSDIKLKQDVVDAGSQWNDIKNLKFRKYRLKSDVEVNSDAKPLLGLIAQEAELVSPGLIEEYKDTKEEKKTREVEKTREIPAVLDEDGNEVEPARTETYTETEEYTETVDLGTTTKSIKTSILYMKAVKALQEAMTRIEALEAEVAALKGQ